MVLLESGEFIEADEEFAGHVAISQSKKNPLSVLIATNENTDNVYLLASDIETYMQASHTIDPCAVLESIAEANQIDINSFVVVVDVASSFVISELTESGVVMERAAEADATTVNKVMRWYERLLRKSKQKTYSINAVKSRITILTQCIEKMEDELRKVETGESYGGAIAYNLKAMIPWNGLFRLIKNDDVYAGLGFLAFVGATVVTADPLVGYVPEIVVRKVNYEKMLKRLIANTKEAVDYLQKQYDELKKDSNNAK